MNFESVRMLGLVVAVALGCSATGCASITATKTFDYTVNSNPPGAEVRVNGAPVGTAPATIQVPRKEFGQIEVVAQGYKPAACHPSMGPGTFYLVSDAILCVVLFPIGCISFIDATGAWNEPASNQCNVTLAPEYAQPPPPPPPPAYGPPPRS